MFWMARNDRIAKISLSNYSGALTPILTEGLSNQIA